MEDMDKKAKKILMNTFWSGKGWIDYRTIEFSGSDFEYAKAKGIMFDPVSMHHDECIEKLKQVAGRITKQEVAASFLSSLSTRALHLRSAISSWVFAQELLNHTFNPYIDSNGSTQMSYLCGICNRTNMHCSERYENENLNVLNFERIKWGGIRLNHVLYCLFDLEQFTKLEKMMPTDEDYAILKQILKTVETIPLHDGPRQLEQGLKDIFKSSKNERDVVIEILACIGVLQPGSHNRPTRGGKNDWNFAANWRGEDGYNQESVRFYFDILNTN